MNTAEVFGHMCALATQSKAHANYTLADAYRLFIPPISLGQFLMFGDGSGFATWAYLSREAADGYRTRTRKLQPDDWKSGDEIWFVDLIAPFGNVRPLIRGLAEKFPKGAQGYCTRRYNGSREVGRVGTWINA
jgi:cytolysin-activating lysine-acyltransferase